MVTVVIVVQITMIPRRSFFLVPFAQKVAGVAKSHGDGLVGTRGKLEKRLEHAKELLAISGLSVTDILLIQKFINFVTSVYKQT